MVAVGLLGVAARAAVERPAYVAGNRWVYELEGSLATLPGLNESGAEVSELTLAGRVDVEVRGTAERLVEGVPVRGVEAVTRTTAFLNGTFLIPGGPSPVPATVSGTLTSELSELWEDTGFLPVESRDATVYRMDISYIVPIHVEGRTYTNATTSIVAADVPFPIDVGGLASASLTTNVSVNTTFSAFGQTISFENHTIVSSTWTREVLFEEAVSVEAGTFVAYRMNQTLGALPGLAGAGPASGANETVHWSNDVGYYARRVAYANGTPVAEMRLRSYSYGTAPGDLSIVLVVIGAVIVGVAAVVFLAWRRSRKGQIGSPVSRPATDTEAPRRSKDREESDDAR